MPHFLRHLPAKNAFFLGTKRRYFAAYFVKKIFLKKRFWRKRPLQALHFFCPTNANLAGFIQKTLFCIYRIHSKLYVFRLSAFAPFFACNAKIFIRGATRYPFFVPFSTKTQPLPPLWGLFGALVGAFFLKFKNFGQKN